MLQCWEQKPEKRPHFWQIVEKEHKILDDSNGSDPGSAKNSKMPLCEPDKSDTIGPGMFIWKHALKRQEVYSREEKNY